MEKRKLNNETAQEFQDAAVKRGDLIIWTIYDHPNDFPSFFVARPHSTKTRSPCDLVLAADTLEEIREILPSGLRLFLRNECDDEKIVENWI